MTFKNLLLSSLLLIGQIIFAQTADHLVISEVLVNGKYESSPADNDEFVEIYNPTSESVDASGLTVDYRSASGTTFNMKYTFPSGAMILPHKYYLIGGGGVANRDNTSDSQTLGLGNSGGGIFLRNSSGNTIDLVGWGTAASDNYEGTVLSVPSEGISLERKANSASNASTMSSGGADELEGNGYDSDNNAADFVQRTTPQPQNSSSPAEPAIDNGGNGTGKVSVFPNMIDASETTDLTFKVIGDGTHTLDSILIVIPSTLGWTWSGDLLDVNLSGGAVSSQSFTIVSDTIFIDSIAITNTDSLIIKVSNVTAPSEGGYTDFVIKTALLGGVPLAVSPSARINVLKTVPIIDVHINDVSGVPAAPYGTGASVTVSGIITADLNDTRTDIYVQDSTAGIKYL